MSASLLSISVLSVLPARQLARAHAPREELDAFSVLLSEILPYLIHNARRRDWLLQRTGIPTIEMVLEPGVLQEGCMC